MSVAISFFNQRGIIVSADRRIVTSVVKSENSKDSFMLTNTEQKLFAILDKFALTFTGTASLRGIPTSCIIRNYIDRFNLELLPPPALITSLAKYIRSFHGADNDNCVLILSGYDQGVPFILSANTMNPNSTTCHISQDEPSSVVYSGESNILNIFLNSGFAKYDYGEFTLQDAIDFSRFLIRTTSEWQRFQQCLQTVSAECDILCITPNNFQWIEHLSLR